MPDGFDLIFIGIICVSIALGYMLGAALGWLIFGSCFILMGLAIVVIKLIRSKRHD